MAQEARSLKEVGGGLAAAEIVARWAAGAAESLELKAPATAKEAIRSAERPPASPDGTPSRAPAGRGAEGETEPIGSELGSRLCLGLRPEPIETAPEVHRLGVALAAADLLSLDPSAASP